MQLLDQEEFKKLFNGYYHDENFNEEMNKEKEKIEQQNKQSCQTRSLGAAQTTVGQRGAGQRNESSMESQSQGNDPQS